MPKFNDLIYCKYTPKEGNNLNRMLFLPNVPIKNVNHNWNLKKGVRHAKIAEAEWITDNGFLTPYGSFAVEDKYHPIYSRPEFNAREFFKDKNIYIVWELKNKNDDNGTTVANLYPRITWNNRKGFVKKQKNEKNEKEKSNVNTEQTN